MKLGKKTFFLFRLLVTLAILFALFKFIPYKEIVEVYRGSRKIYLLFGFLTLLCGLLIGMNRWRFLLSSLGIKVSLREASYAFFCGLFFNLFFPSFIAGDVFRGFSLSYRYGDLKKVASTILMDRFSGAVALILIALLSFTLAGDILREKWVVVSLIIMCVIMIFSFFVIFSKSFFLFLIRIFKKNSLLSNKLISFHDQLHFFKSNPKIFIKSLLFSFPIQVLTSLSFFVVSKAFNLEVGVVYFLVLVPIVMVIAFIPITIAGAGTREASAVYFFSLLGIDKSIGLGISLANLIFIVAVSILGGVFYVTAYHRWFQPRPQETNL